MAKELIKGNVAVAEAAVLGGMNFFAGYPITPSTEILEHLSEIMDPREFIQAENEVAAINMVMGASSCGARAMTASSGPGISLKASGMSYAAKYELPYVVVNVQRWGVGLGTLDSGQSDYFRDVKGGGHGEYHNIVFAPKDIQELVDMTYNAWDYAEKYRIGVTILSEAQLGQMMESVTLPKSKKRTEAMNWGIDGTGDVGVNPEGSGGPQRAMLLALKVKARYDVIEETEQQWESIDVEDAETVLVAFGLPARSAIIAVRELRAQGEKVGLIRPKTLWPYPFKAYDQCKNAKRFISVESNTTGMAVEDVALAVKKAHIDAPVYCYAYGAGVPKTKEIIAEYREIIANNRKERF